MEDLRTSSFLAVHCTEINTTVTKHKRESIECHRHHHTIAMNTIAIAIAVIITTTTASRSRSSNSMKHNACASCDQAACDRWLLCFTDMDSRSNLLQAVGRDPVMSKQASILPAQMQNGYVSKHANHWRTCCNVAITAHEHVKRDYVCPKQRATDRTCR